MDTDPAAIVEKHLGALLAYLRFLGCDAATAEDLAQEAFVVLFSKPFEAHDDLATSGYLRATAKNLYLSHARKERRRADILALEAADRVWERRMPGPWADEYLAALKRCMETLDERTRRAVVMRYEDGQDGAHIAKALELSEAGANTLIHRGKETLKHCIERRAGA